MLCLGIESSCDETGLALIEEGSLLGQVLASQSEVHALFGGVVPELASREHYRYIGVLFDELLRRTNKCVEDIDYISVARGPGLLGSLLVGVSFAKALALGLNVPLVGVNHLHAHLLVTGLHDTLHFPCLGLLISGGHTNIYRIEGVNKFVLLGKTLDDAVGEVIDKIGNVLGLPYPSGKIFDSFACQGQNKRLFTPPYLQNNNLDFSFSGLKTAALSFLTNNNLVKNRTVTDLNNFCASFLFAIAETLCSKVSRALDQNKDLSSVVVAGGVAASTFLRKALATCLDKKHCSLNVPPFNLCSDNAVMIAYTGYLLGKMGFRHDLNMETIPRGKVIPNDLLCNSFRYSSIV